MLTVIMHGSLWPFFVFAAGYIPPLFARTIRSWSITVVLAALVVAALGLLAGGSGYALPFFALSLGWLIVGLLSGLLTSLIRVATPAFGVSIPSTPVFVAGFITPLLAYELIGLNEGRRNEQAYARLPLGAIFASEPMCSQFDTSTSLLPISVPVKDGGAVNLAVPYAYSHFPPLRPDYWLESSTGFEMLVANASPTGNWKAGPDVRNVPPTRREPYVFFQVSNAEPVPIAAAKQIRISLRDDTFPVSGDMPKLRLEVISDRGLSKIQNQPTRPPFAKRDLYIDYDGSEVRSQITCSPAGSTANPVCAFITSVDGIRIDGRFQTAFVEQWPEIRDRVGDFIRCGKVAASRVVSSQ